MTGRSRAYHHRLRLAMRACVGAALMAVGAATASGQLIINGNRAFSDDSTNLILYSVPADAYDTHWQASVQVDPAGGWTNITLDGRSLREQPFTFRDMDGGRVYVLRAMSHGKRIVKRLMFTALPIVELQGDIGYDYAPAQVTLLTPEGRLEEGMTARVKWRGGSTNTDGRHKRNYSIKFVDDAGEKQNRRLLGMRSDNHWILDAAQLDMSRVRNRVATDLWLDMSREPCHADREPDALTGARGQMAEVFVNGNYRGIYSLGECLDRKQLKLKKYDEDGEFHGLLWKSLAWTGITAFKSVKSYNNNSADYDAWQIRYPDFEEVAPTRHNDLYTAARFVRYSAMSTFNNDAERYFDIPLLIDYTIFIQFLNAVDNEVNNLFWFIYDTRQSPRLSLAVWDLDWTVGMNRLEPSLHGGRMEPENYFETSSYLLERFYDSRCVWHRPMLDRWRELRRSWLSEKSLKDRYSRAIDELISCGAAAREEARWSGDSDINGLPLSLAAEKEYINDWITRRLSFVDRGLMRHYADVNGDGAVNAADLTCLWEVIAGQRDKTGLQPDVNGDGAVNAADIQMLYSLLMGM